MNLYRIGDTVLNLDRINGIMDHQVATDPDAREGPTVLRVVFDNAQIDLKGKEALVLRRWARHAARDLAPRRDEDGEDLISPEDQVKRALDSLIALINHARPKEPAMRHAAHRLTGMIDLYLTGELRPVRAGEFERSLGAPHADT